MFVDTSPIFPIHDIQKTPKYLFFILDMHEKHSCDVIHSLDISYLRIIITVCQEHIVEHSLALNTFPIEIFALTLQVFQSWRIICKSSCYVLFYLDYIAWLRNRFILQLLIHTLTMHRFFPLAPTKHAPNITSDILWNTINNWLPDPLSGNDLEWIKGLAILCRPVDAYKSLPLIYGENRHIFPASQISRFTWSGQ